MNHNSTCNVSSSQERYHDVCVNSTLPCHLIRLLNSSTMSTTIRSKVESEMEMLGKPENVVTRFFQEARHTEEIVGMQENAEERDIWRKYGKERMKTVSVALVLCLHIGVEPPDREPRPQPCAKMQAWVDPYSSFFPNSQKAIAKIAASLQKNYERWQPRARYKVATDPTVEEVRRLCTSMRRNAKDERVLFHYNGHGVPRPTSNGEIWVFNKNFTQYIPLSIYDLQTWMETPSIYVWDCDSAETIVNSFNRFAGDQEKDWNLQLDEFQENTTDQLPPITSSMGREQQAEALNFTKKKPRFKDCIQLAACRVDETLPTNPDLPADLFTSCLTTPIQTSILWYLLKTGRKNEFPNIMEDIPGQLTDRRSLLGELNWIFTAITDTMAWNALPRDVFQRLFRQDLLLASLFRSFLLAERIMGANGCNVVSCPALPSTAEHPLWEAWEYTIDLCLNHLSAQNSAKISPDSMYSLGKDVFRNSNLIELNSLLETSNIVKQPEPPTDSQYNSFFIEQLGAFEVWLEYGVEQKTPPRQLPVVLQVLLSQVHRVRALELLARFLDHGQWAVGYALSVGIFPYVLKLLQSNTRELKPWLAFIWAKILAVDPGCQAELFKENGEESRYDSINQRKEKKELRYFYFVKILNDPLTSARQKVVPAFVLATLFHNNYRTAQENLTEQGYVNLCTELLSDNSVRECRLLKLWLLIGLGRLWADYNESRWQAIRLVAYAKVQAELKDRSAEVRAAAVYSIGCLVKNRADRNEHALAMAQELCDSLCSLCTRDGSMLVREELLVALQYFVMDAVNILANLHRRLIEQVAFNEIKRKEALFRPREEKGREAREGETVQDETDSSMIHVETGYEENSLRSDSKLLLSGRKRNHASESSVAIDELVNSMKQAETAASIASMRYISAFSSEDVAYREEASKMLSILEAKNFADPPERIWIAVLRLSLDPIEKIARMAQVLVKYVMGLAEQKSTRASELISNLSSADLTRADSPIPFRVPFDVSAIQHDHTDNGKDEIDHANGGVTFTVGSPQPIGFLSTTPVNSGGAFSSNLSTPLGPMRKHSVPFTPMTSTPRSQTAKELNMPSLLTYEYQPKRKLVQKIDTKEMTLEQKVNRMRREEEFPQPPPLLDTQFVPWCSRVFTEPILDLIQAEDADGTTEAVLTQANATDWAMHMEEGMRQLGDHEYARGNERMELFGEHRFMHRREGMRRVASSAFSLLRPYLYYTDGDSIEMIHYDSGKTSLVNTFPHHAGNPFVSDRANWLEVINPMSTEMLLSGSASGIIRVWNVHLNLHSHEMEGESTLVTAAFPLSDQTRIGEKGMSNRDITVYDWNQSQGRLLCTGNVKVCRLWDVHAENGVCDVQTGRKSAVQAMSAELDRSHLVALGFRDGAVHVHDIRMPTSESRILSLSEHTQPIVGVSLRSEGENSTLLAATSMDGMLCVWEPRMFKEPVVECSIVDELYKETVTGMTMHNSTQHLVCSLSSAKVKIIDISGRKISDLKPFGAIPLIGPSALAFHPCRPLISVSHGVPSDTCVSIFGPPELHRSDERKRDRRERR